MTPKDDIQDESSSSAGISPRGYESLKPQLSVDQSTIHNCPSTTAAALVTETTVKEPNPIEFRSGYRGVSWNRRMKAWLAFWSEGKNRRSKTFNAKVMGFEKARAAAIDFLKKKKQLLQQLDPNFADFDDQFDECGVDDYNGSLADSTTTSSTNNTPSSTPIGDNGPPAGNCQMCVANFLQNDGTGCLYCS
jgi:hypothetical protein